MQAQSFAQHRNKVVEIFHANKIQKGVIVYASPEQPKEPFSESELAFTQEALFFWLTGWEKPDSYIVIDLSTEKSYLSIPKYGDRYEIWTGPIPDKNYVTSKTGVDDVIFNDDIVNFVNGLKKDGMIYSSPLPMKLFPETETTALLAASGLARRTKFDDEVKALRAASHLTGQAIMILLRSVQPGMSEKQIEFLFKNAGFMFHCNEVSFQTIAASGQNSVYLHYTANEGNVNDGDLVLLDCGLFFNHYAGDITRTFPANGKFSPDQALVYNALLKQQIKIINLIGIGTTISKINAFMHFGVFDVLKEIEVIPKDAEFDYTISSLFCPHGCSHHIGCNVHDQTYYKSNLIKDSDHDNETLGINMIISVEPGIYFHPVRLEQAKNDPKYSIIDFEKAFHFAKTVCGIRIEDDILITEDGVEVLSQICPKEIAQIEEIMAAKMK